MFKRIYRGRVQDRLNGCKTVSMTRWCYGWEDAQRKAENLLRKNYGKSDRYQIVVED